MTRVALLTLVCALLAGCGTMPPQNPETNDALLLAKAKDGSGVISAQSFAYQYNDEAALQWVHLYVTPKGLYAAYWDQYAGAYGLSLRLQNEDIVSVTNRPFARGGWAGGTRLVVKDVDGYEFSFAGEKPGDAVELALKRNLELRD